MHARRWEERQRQRALAEKSRALAGVHLGRRNAIAGTSLPAPFPARALLLAAGYGALEDLPVPPGDDDDDAFAELLRAGLDLDDATAVLEARGFTLDES